MTTPHTPFRHLLSTADLSVADITGILDRAEHYAPLNAISGWGCETLKGQTIVNLFFEPSTRTRTSFEIAAKRLGADVINVYTEHSSVKKGETLLDTVLTLNAMQVDAFVIRHQETGVPHFVAPVVRASIINGGDGTNEHPTQALLDALVMRRHKKTLQGLTVAICGDVAHSRVARSNIHLLNKFDCKVRVVAPQEWLPADVSKLPVTVHDRLAEGIAGADVVMMLRIQRERMQDDDLMTESPDFFRNYGLNHQKLKAAKPDVVVMHPGPMNRDVEISSELADDPEYSVIREQVTAGVLVRMACLEHLLLTKST
jgi:aspartate carbamoyltransferase catalytic subunit